MALLKVRRFSQITLPAEVRRKLNVSEGDYLEAEVVKEGILLKPVSVVARKEAWKGLVEVLDRVHKKLPTGKKSPKEQEEEIAQMIKDYRRKHAS